MFKLWKITVAVLKFGDNLLPITTGMQKKDAIFIMSDLMQQYREGISICIFHIEVLHILI